MATKTPRPKLSVYKKQEQENQEEPKWQDICLSPLPSWTPAPPASKLSEEEVDFSPTSITSPRNFNFASPISRSDDYRTTSNPTRGLFLFNSSSYADAPKPYGFLSSEPCPGRKSKRFLTFAIFSLSWIYGGFSWNNLRERSYDPMQIVAPQGSLSELAQTAFAKLYQRDWGAAPPLWVILEAKPGLPNYNQDNGDMESHSFTDDSSIVYYEGKHYHFGLIDFLVDHFRLSGNQDMSSVKITSYYSLRDHGLEYLARNMVTPDGSKTMLQIQYLPNELGDRGVEELKRTIIDYGLKHPSSALDIHYTGITWDPKNGSENMDGILIGLTTLFFAVAAFAGRYYALWAVGTLASMFTTLALTSVLLTHLCVTTTSLSISTAFMLALVLSIYFTKNQVDNYAQFRSLNITPILQAGGILIVNSGSLYVLPSPSLRHVSMACTVSVACSMVFHIAILPQLCQVMPHVRDDKKVADRPFCMKGKVALPERSPTIRSQISLAISAFLLLSLALKCRKMDLPTLDGTANTPFLVTKTRNELHTMGQSMGHGRLIPYRILFDGHKSNISMISLGGYDIVQLVVDELVGIRIPNSDGTEDEFPNEEDGGLAALSGSTHVGEAYTEVQSLIKHLVVTLKQFKERQQEEFDRHHRHRKEQRENRGRQAQLGLESTRSKYNINSGIAATTYTGLSVLENSRIPQSLYSAANICRDMEPRCPSEALHLLNVLEDETTLSDHMATYVNVNLGVDPLSPNGLEWLRLARETIKRLQEDPRVLGGVEVHIDGYAASYEDYKTAQQQILPERLCLALAAIFVSFSVGYRSFWEAFRIMLTALLTTSASLGAGSLIFEDGILRWVHLSLFSPLPDSAKSNDHQVAFGQPVFSMVLACILIVSCSMISDVLSTQKTHLWLEKKGEIIFASGKVVASIFLLLNLFTSNRGSNSMQWPILVSISIFIDSLLTRRTLLFGVQRLSRSKWLSLLAQRKKKECAGTVDISERSWKNEAYLRKYEEFVRSPRAP